MEETYRSRNISETENEFMAPYRALYAETIYRAALDISSQPPKPKKRGEPVSKGAMAIYLLNKSSALSWINYRHSDHVHIFLSFISCCLYLDIDPDKTRAAILSGNMEKISKLRKVKELRDRDKKRKQARQKNKRSQGQPVAT